MTKHIIVSLAIIAVVYSAVVYVNRDVEPVPIAEQPIAAEWAYYVAQDPALQYKVPVPERETESNIPAHPVIPAAQADTLTVKPAPTLRPAQVQSDASSTKGKAFKGFNIVGFTDTVSLSNTRLAQQQVQALWQRFQGASELHDRVNWEPGIVNVYAYYHSFNATFSEGKVTVGYAQNSVALRNPDVVSVASGESTRIAMDKATGLLPASAWTQAYPDGVILERHRMDISGDILSADALIIKAR